jgi:two-component system response regulator YesN
MYKVLLVDDEHYDLEGLKQLVPWADVGLQVVDAVHSGRQALEIIAKVSDIDILVTDVMMPRMSGLELAMKARELVPQVKVVFISGYQEFEFARKAIELSAAGYVLKPVDDNELLRVLKTVVEQLDRERVVRQLEHVSHGELLYQWLEDLASDDQRPTILARVALPDKGCGYRSAVVEIDDVHWKLNRYPLRERETKINETVKVVRQRIAEHGRARWCRLGNYQFAVVFACDEDDLTWLQSLREEAPRVAGLSMTIALGQRVDQFEQVIDSYQEAKELLSYKLFLGKDRIITASDRSQVPSIAMGDIDDILNKMFLAMTNYELAPMEQYLQEVFAFAYRFQQRLTAQNFGMYVISRLETYLQRMNQSLYSLLHIEFADLDILFRFETIEDIRQWLGEQLRKIADILYARRQDRHGKLIEDIERFVEERIADGATLRDVAQHFSFSPNYLSHLFREKTGERFSAYMARKRLDKACELLRTTNIKVFEISDLLGYSTVTYFSRQFRNVYGMTPGDYRRQSEALRNKRS